MDEYMSTGDTVICLVNNIGLVKGQSYTVEAIGNGIRGLTVKINGGYVLMRYFEKGDNNA